jgi:hypothetical protein
MQLGATALAQARMDHIIMVDYIIIYNISTLWIPRRLWT